MSRPDRMHWVRKISTLDPETDFWEIYRITSAHEFPWDMNQALSFALFRTYAVPSIGGLLHRTGEFTERTQKRYDDTALLLAAILEFGFDSAEGRTAIRRINRMHGAYDISNDDMRYVLTTFVAVPIRWLEEYGWRPMCENEKVASANYYRRLGTMMNIRDVPETWPDFCEAMDEYERSHFAYDAGGRAVADATVDLMTTFPPNDMAPASAMRRVARGLMDPALLRAFDHQAPTRIERLAYRGSLRVRGRMLRVFPPRMKPLHTQGMKNLRYYPDGYRLSELGTFPERRAVGVCPVPH